MAEERPEIVFTLRDKRTRSRVEREAKEATIEFELESEIRRARRRLEKS